MNYLMPARDVLPMHCSVSVGEDGTPAVFFGLSGTGKTTLSADPHRMLLGDDEHGWSQDGLFNFEGGCYAKVIHLSASAEPAIHATTRMFGTVLENVVMDPDTHILDLDDGSHTENTRGAYPLASIPNASSTGVSDHPTNIVMLTADAFGVLPPIARLTPEQAIYHFLSAIRQRLRGRSGVSGGSRRRPSPTCFGGPLHAAPANDLCAPAARADRDDRRACWLVNTGWTGGPYGTGERMEIAHTRALLSAALEGALDGVSCSTDNPFGLAVPRHCPGVPDTVLDARGTWADKNAYDEQARVWWAASTPTSPSLPREVDKGVQAAAPMAA